MARVTSLIEIQGTLGGITFYKTRDGYFARSRTSVSKGRLLNDPAYAGTRQNMSLFKRAAHAGKLFRTVFRTLLDRGADTAITARLVGRMHSVINSDTGQPRGEGTVQQGNPQLLEGFECNDNARLVNTLLAPVNASIARKRGVMVVDIPEFHPKLALRAPQGATHYRFFSGGAAIDFDNNTYNNATSQSKYLPVVVEMTQPVQLIIEIKPRSTGIFFVLLGIEFVQIVNGVPFSMRNGHANPLAVVAVKQ